MKRRLPTINQGESVLVAISFPPLIVEMNRHNPTCAQPGNPAAARHAATTAANAHPVGLLPGVSAASPSSTARADNATAQRVAPAAKRRHQPRAVVCGTPSRAAGGRTPDRPPATSAITWPIDSTTSRRPTSTNAGSTAWVFSHDPQRTRGTKIR
jgi:hypothetical protein